MAFIGGFWSRGWIWVSIVVRIVMDVFKPF